MKRAGTLLRGVRIKAWFAIDPLPRHWVQGSGSPASGSWDALIHQLQTRPWTPGTRVLASLIEQKVSGSGSFLLLRRFEELVDLEWLSPQVRIRLGQLLTIGQLARPLHGAQASAPTENGPSNSPADEAVPPKDREPPRGCIIQDAVLRFPGLESLGGSRPGFTSGGSYSAPRRPGRVGNYQRARGGGAAWNAQRELASISAGPTRARGAQPSARGPASRFPGLVGAAFGAGSAKGHLTSFRFGTYAQRGPYRGTRWHAGGVARSPAPARLGRVGTPGPKVSGPACGSSPRGSLSAVRATRSSS